jgi:hypothetical protein
VSIDGGGPTDAKPIKDAAREANAPGCPAQYADAPPGHCTIGLACAYDEGTCTCVDYCGGAPPPPNEDFSHWSCKLYDDCPQPKPQPNTTCKKPGQTCTYGACCIEQLTCVGSKWSSGGVVCPP